MQDHELYVTKIQHRRRSFQVLYVDTCLKAILEIHWSDLGDARGQQQQNRRNWGLAACLV